MPQKYHNKLLQIVRSLVTHWKYVNGFSLLNYKLRT